MRAKTYKGVTLVELMIAMGLLSVFALMLVNVLSQSISTWRVTEEKREILEISRNVMDVVTEDLESIFISDDPTEDGLLLDYDANGKQRLRFIRKISQENRHPILRYAASDPKTKKKKEHYDLKADRGKNLLAPGGLAEIVYCFVSQDNGTLGLYRGIRAPIGGDGSFFDDKNLDNDNKVNKSCHLLAKQILHMEVKFWKRNTTTWDSKKVKGANLIWDSTKKKLNDFELFGKGNPNLAAKPTKVNITLVTQNGAPKELMSDLLATDNVAYISNTVGMRNNLRYMFVNGEWILYEDVAGSQVLNLQRGFWNTKAKDHLQLTARTRKYYEEWDVKKELPRIIETQEITKVYIGIPFVKTIDLPFY